MSLGFHWYSELGGFVAFALHCLFIFPSSPRVLPQDLLGLFPLRAPLSISDVGKAPNYKVLIAVDLSDASVPQLEHSLRQRVQFVSGRQIHARKADSPRNDIGDQVRQLHSGCQVAMNEKRLRQDLAGPRSSR